MWLTLSHLNFKRKFSHTEIFADSTVRHDLKWLHKLKIACMITMTIAGVLQFGAETGGFQKTEDSTANHKENGE